MGEKLDALSIAEEALNTWLHTYASDMCHEDDVAKAYARIRAAGGTLGYITDALEAVRGAQGLAGLRAKENGNGL